MQNVETVKLLNKLQVPKTRLSLKKKKLHLFAIL